MRFALARIDADMIMLHCRIAAANSSRRDVHANAAAYSIFFLQ